MKTYSKDATLKKSIGTYYETLAKRYLEKQGLRLVCSNYFCKMGEIDLIMRDGEYLVFVEVRSRAKQGYGSGADSISPAKQNRIMKTALLYLQQNNLLEKIPCRFDVISINAHNNEHQIDWIPDAFQT